MLSKKDPPWKTYRLSRRISTEKLESVSWRSKWDWSGWTMPKDTSSTLALLQVFVRFTRWWSKRKKRGEPYSSCRRSSQITVWATEELMTESKATRTLSKTLRILKTSTLLARLWLRSGTTEMWGWMTTWTTLPLLIWWRTILLWFRKLSTSWKGKRSKLWQANDIIVIIFGNLHQSIF